jgi:hypothetical protein
MSPPISKDWWIAAALTSAALPGAIAQQGSPLAPSGVITTTEPGKPPLVQPLVVEAVRGQKIVTGPNQTVHVLFPDQSAATVGPNSEMTLVQLEYDARNKNGNIAVDLAKGFLRVVGGFVSKRNGFMVRTPTATIGVRGGISVIGTGDQGTQAQFLFGQEMQVTGINGGIQNIYRPGFGVFIGFDGFPGPPFRPPPPPPPQAPSGPPAVGGGTLPGAGGPNLNKLAPDRLPTARQPLDPNQPAGKMPTPPTLNDILGGPPTPGNQS